MRWGLPADENGVLVEVVNKQPIAGFSELSYAPRYALAARESVIIEGEHPASLHSLRYPTHDVDCGLISVYVDMAEADAAIGDKLPGVVREHALENGHIAQSERRNQRFDVPLGQRRHVPRLYTRRRTTQF